MTRLEVFEQLLSEMSRAEKAQVLQWVVRDLGEAFPGIESRPDICGGGERQIRENEAAPIVPIPRDPLDALRGSGRGERLVERLLQSRREDREVGEGAPE